MVSLFGPTDTASTTAFAQIAVERAVDRYPNGLTYAIPPALAPLTPGERVLVPLGRGDKPTPGCVISVADTPSDPDLDPKKIKPILKRDGQAPALPARLIELARWISTYYCTPIGITLATVTPAAVKKQVGLTMKTFVELTINDLVEISSQQGLSKKQKKVVEIISSADPATLPLPIERVMDDAELKTKGPINRLEERGLLRFVRRSTIQAKWAEWAADDRAPERLTPAQQSIVQHVARDIAPTPTFARHLLFGVTGSGKTEVYIQLIRRALAAGRTALVLVPEIALTPQTAGRLVGRFPDHKVAILHSGLTAAQRNQQWALAASGNADIVLGARSAVFAPIPDDRLGLIIVDEEHDGSYKQDQAPRYHGRDVAIRRAQMESCPILLGSATPSLESWRNAHQAPGWTLHELRERAPGMQLPKVHVLDFAEERKHHRDRRVHLIGPTMLNALGATLDDGGQVLLLLNRRGYASYLACPDQKCGWVMTCDHCDVTTVYHRNESIPSGGYVQCHHCQTEQKLPPTCPDCGRKISTFGFGTQRVIQELEDIFPELIPGETMERVDSDTMHGARDLATVLERFGRGELKLLAGTQMIAKGLDFPNLRMVGVINADTALNLPDFRATERTFQLVSQVAGRCGRSDKPGTVYVQTFNPDVPAIRLAALHDYPTFARLEMNERESVRMPPVVRLVRFIIREEDREKCVHRARILAEAVRAIAADGCVVRGPIECAIGRIAGKFRQEIRLFGANAAAVQRTMAQLRSRGLIRSDAGMIVDVDPVNLI